MNATLNFVERKAEYEAAKKAVKAICYQLRAAADETEGTKSGSEPPVYPDWAELNAAVQRRNAAFQAVKDAWELVDEDHRPHLVKGF